MIIQQGFEVFVPKWSKIVFEVLSALACIQLAIISTYLLFSIHLLLLLIDGSDAIMPLVYWVSSFIYSQSQTIIFIFNSNV